MSRWSDQFQNHPVHEALRQVREWLSAEAVEVDADHQIEKRRLTKFLDYLGDDIASIDPEFFSDQQLTSLNQVLRSSQIWNNLQAYSSSPSTPPLQAANDYLTAQIPSFPQLPILSRQPKARETVKAVEGAYDDFARSIGKHMAEFESRLGEGHSAIAELKQKTDALQATLKELQTTTDSTLSGWQSDFTTAQTTRAEEHSLAQINRGEKFDETLRDWRTKSEVEIKDISEKHEKKLIAVFEKFEKEAADRTADMEAKHAAILEIHGLVGTDGVAGGYQKGAIEERAEANLWRIIAMFSLGAAAVWLGIKYHLGFSLTILGNVNWPEVITAGSLTLVLLAAAGYASRQSKSHRESEQQLRWFALEVKAIDPFISSLPEEKQIELKTQLSQKLFGQNRTTTDKGEGEFSPSAVKSISDGILTPILELVKLAKH